MANTTTNLTDIQPKRAKPRDKEYNLSDPGGGFNLELNQLAPPHG